MIGWRVENMKLLYTRKDRLEYYKTCIELSGIPLDPFTNIRVNRGKTIIEEEQAKQDYIIEGFGVNFPLGHVGLVSVVFLKDGVQICPAVGEGIIGDNQIFQIQDCIELLKGEVIKVKIINNDELDHMVGVRVDIYVSSGEINK